MFSDLPTPAYNQSNFNQQAIPGFQPLAAQSNRIAYAPQRQQAQSFGDSDFPAPPMYQANNPNEFASLNALSAGGGNKQSRRESSMMGANHGLVNQRSMNRLTLRDTSSSRIPEQFQSFAAQQRAREATPERRYQQQQSSMY